MHYDVQAERSAHGTGAYCVEPTTGPQLVSIALVVITNIFQKKHWYVDCMLIEAKSQSVTRAQTQLPGTEEDGQYADIDSVSFRDTASDSPDRTGDDGDEASTGHAPPMDDHYDQLADLLDTEYEGNHYDVPRNHYEGLNPAAIDAIRHHQPPQDYAGLALQTGDGGDSTDHIEMSVFDAWNNRHDIVSEPCYTTCL